MPVRKPDNIQVHRIELGKKERKWIEDFVLPQQLMKTAVNGTVAIAIGGSIVLVSYGTWWALKELYGFGGKVKDTVTNILDTEVVGNIDVGDVYKTGLKVNPIIGIPLRILDIIF